MPIQQIAQADVKDEVLSQHEGCVGCRALIQIALWRCQAGLSIQGGVVSSTSIMIRGCRVTVDSIAWMMWILTLLLLPMTGSVSHS